MPELLEVELPVCPTCQLVGKLPSRTYASGMRFKCIGPEGKGHKPEPMQYKLFREVSDVQEG